MNDKIIAIARQQSSLTGVRLIGEDFLLRFAHALLAEFLTPVVEQRDALNRLCEFNEKTMADLLEKLKCS